VTVFGDPVFIVSVVLGLGLVLALIWLGSIGVSWFLRSMPRMPYWFGSVIGRLWRSFREGMQDDSPTEIEARHAAPPQIAVQPTAPSKTGRVCPYCKDAIPDAVVHIECATCSTWHHATCFEENGGCSVFGCREQRGRGVARLTQR
jgi:hypothetical protein